MQRLADGLKIARGDNLEPDQGQHQHAGADGANAQPGQVRQGRAVAGEEPNHLRGKDHADDEADRGDAARGDEAVCKVFFTRSNRSAP